MRNWLNSFKRLLGGKTKRPLPLRTREQPRRRKLGVEWLEDRITPSTLSYNAGTKLLQLSGQFTNQNVTISVDSAGTYTINDATDPIADPLPTGWSRIDPNT